MMQYNTAKVKLLFNTEWQYDHGMAVNYRGKKFYNMDSRLMTFSVPAIIAGVAYYLKDILF